LASKKSGSVAAQNKIFHLPFIDVPSVSDRFNPNVLLLIDEIDDSVGANSKRKFAFKIAEQLFSGKGI
jgi:hypothetical protein